MRGGSWTVDLFIVDTEDLKTMPPSEINVKRFKSKEVDIQKGDAVSLYSHAGRAKSCKKDCRYPLVCTKRGAPSGENLNTLLQKRRISRDPDPDVEARQDFCSIMEGSIYRNRVAPKTKLCVPKDDFRIPLNYADIQKQNRALMYFKRRPSVIIGTWMETKSLSEPWISVTRFALLKKNPQEGLFVGSRQTDEETGHNKTRKHLAGMNGHTCQQLSA